MMLSFSLDEVVNVPMNQKHQDFELPENEYHGRAVLILLFLIQRYISSVGITKLGWADL